MVGGGGYFRFLMHIIFTVVKNTKGLQFVCYVTFGELADIIIHPCPHSLAPSINKNTKTN